MDVTSQNLILVKMVYNDDGLSLNMFMPEDENCICTVSLEFYHVTI